jgi:hypothetical protein
MFDETDPELEAKAPGALRVLILLAGVVLGWGLVVAGYVFTVRVLIPAFHALGGLI